MSHPTLLCLGSGLAPRYRLNTLQALALPQGSHLQFRYEVDLVPKGLHKGLDDRKLNGATVLMGHVDCTASGRQADGRCFIVPYRQAELLDSRRRGSVFLLTLKMFQFSLVTNLDAFQRSLPGDVPRWKQALDGEPVLDSKGKPKFEGSWCQEVSDLQSAVRTDNVGDWQQIATQLRGREDFSTQPYFFLVEGLFRRQKRIKDDILVELENGEYCLRSGQDYELRIFHFDPDSNAHTGWKPTQWLKLDVSTPLLTLRNNPLLSIDSPYDLKSIHFSTGETNRKEYGSFFLHPNESQEIVPDLYLPVSVKGDWWKAVRNGFILGALLTAAQLVSVFSKEKIDNWQAVTILVVVLGFLTGFFVSLGMRKPL
jgi:hypothetical protein